MKTAISVFNQSGIQTVLVAVITGNLRLAAAPGNVLLPAEGGLPRESVINVSQIFALDRAFLLEPVGSISGRTRLAVDDGLRLTLGL